MGQILYVKYNGTINVDKNLTRFIGHLPSVLLQNRIEWSTDTEGNPGAHVTLWLDGNLLVMHRPGGNVLWDSNTQGITNIKQLILQNDGHLVLCQEDGSVAWDNIGKLNI